MTQKKLKFCNRHYFNGHYKTQRKFMCYKRKGKSNKNSYCISNGKPRTPITEVF